MIDKILKKIYLKIWSKFNSKKGNIHIGFDSSKLKKLPWHKDKVFLRPTSSDVSRVIELYSNIYMNNSTYLHKELLKRKPKLLIDVGANIGLATYSLVNEFKSLKKVIGIEAESLNYDMLEANYKQFNKMSLDRIVFEPIHALASNYSGSYVAPKKSINEFDKKTTSSGTFRFSPTLKPTKNDIGIRSISLVEILSKKNIKEGIIVKIDIEGGEKYLFEKNHDWLKKVLYVTIELHDRYGIGLVDSSKNFLAAITKYDFAIVPEKDILHCYNRKLFYSNK